MVRCEVAYRYDVVTKQQWSNSIIFATSHVNIQTWPSISLQKMKQGKVPKKQSGLIDCLIEQIMAMTSALSSSAALGSFSFPQRLLGLKTGTFLRQRVHNLHADKICKQTCRAVLGSNASKNATEIKGKDYDLPPPGCSRVKVELSRPMGIVLEEDKVGNIFVTELVKDGNAEKSGLVDIGDQLIATSAIVYGSVEDYQGVKVRKGMQTVRLNVRGERFETVMAAIGTHPGHLKVTLELQKCKDIPLGVNNGRPVN